MKAQLYAKIKDMIFFKSMGVKEEGRRCKDLSGSFLSCSSTMMRQIKTHVAFFQKRRKGVREHTLGLEG